MKKTLTIITLLITINTFAQKKLPFEPIVAKTLDGKEIRIPEDIKGKESMLFLAFSDKSKESLITWAEPVWNTFMVKNPLNVDAYDCNIYLVVMLFGFTNIVQGEIEKQLRKNFNKDWHPYILLHSGTLKPYTDDPDFKKRHQAHVFVFDKEGNHTYHSVGPYSAPELHKIEAAIAGE